jgi:hypothetical protein
VSPSELLIDDTRRIAVNLLVIIKSIKILHRICALLSLNSQRSEVRTTTLVKI